jgi:alkylation response protein AidB-like acyl-CoA dehydrogenase
MTTVNLLYTDTDDALRDSVRRLLADRCSPALVATMYETSPHDFSSAWKSLAAELGLSGLLIPEEFGGAGATVRESSVVMEEIGRTVAPVPYLSSAVLATVALLRARDTDTVRKLAAGGCTAALLMPLSTAPGDAVVGVAGDERGLTGTVTSVAGAIEADVLVVPVIEADGVGLHVVDCNSPGVKVTAVVSLDMTRPLADVELADTPSRRVNGDADKAITDALGCGAILLASEQLGVAQWCFDTAVTYVKERRQFGRAVGSFQAVKHRLADLWLELGTAASVARYAVDTWARADADAAVAMAVAQAYCGDVAVHAAEECIQFHGGAGMTWEYPAHLYLKRAKGSQIALGTPHRHRARLAEFIDVPVSD